MIVISFGFYQSDALFIYAKSAFEFTLKSINRMLSDRMKFLGLIRYDKVITK